MLTTANLPLVVSLEDKHAVGLDVVGGKGANLAILFQRNFPVPDAFIITTYGYMCVLNDERAKASLQALDALNVDNITELESVSETIRAAICNVELPQDLAEMILHSYDRLCDKRGRIDIHVAVRSSATAEDLPDNSFAGQQDTYLHVVKDNLLQKVKECWASLFTARAISYRKKSNIDHSLVRLAVVVQEMLPSEASGVAFTANPITGLRKEVVIDSTYGLGEALVSGLVTPDHYEISFDNGQQPAMRVKSIGEKSIRIIGRSDGGTDTLNTENDERTVAALSDEHVIQLAILAKQVERSYADRPQDLEWSFVRGELYILQARPITTLFPIPVHAGTQSGLRCMFSFGAVQGFLEPMTPLGQSSIRTLFGHIGRAVGIHQNVSSEDDMSADPSRHTLIKSAANRLWLDITGVLTSPFKRRFGMSLIDTGMNRIVQYIKYAKDFPAQSRLSFLITVFHLAFFVVPLFARSIRSWIFPRYAKRRFTKQMEQYHHFVDRGFDEQHCRTFTDCVRHFQNVFSVLAAHILRVGGPCVMPGVLSLKLLQKMAANPVDALALTRAVESNPTTEMNLVLWQLTVLIKENDQVRNLFANESTATLVDMYQRGLFNRQVQTAMEGFFQVYGCRGIGEIDIGRRRWSDEPQAIIEQIKSYLKIVDPNKAISKIHKESQQSAYQTLHQMGQQLRWPLLQRPVMNFLFTRLRILFSVRESPKFDGLIRTFDKCRRALCSKAQLAVQENFITQPDDVFFLYIAELQQLALDTDQRQYGKQHYWKDLIAQRRAEHQKQMSCKRVPLILLSDGTTYYDATTVPSDDAEEAQLMEGEHLGSPVSPGVYEGKVRVVHDPLNSQLQPGEILVCTATDPAWTSLFPIAGALVLEMGGMLQHGAIVSREYGLPAVVGVANAKTIFHDGQSIQVNGSNGRIKVLSDG